MKVTKLIKCWEFGEAQRAETVLSLGARIDPQTHHLTLTEGATEGEARTPIASIRCVRFWLLFQAMAVTPDGTAIGFRLNDGSDELYWDGGAWSLATLDAHWSSNADVSTNIGAFDWTKRKLGVAIRLTATAEALPYLTVVKALYNGDWRGAHDELIMRSLIPDLRDNVEFIKEGLFRNGSGGAVGSFTTSFKGWDRLDVKDVLCVFNITADPEQNIDLLDTYDVGTKTATLTSAIPDGSKALAVCLVEPKVAFTTSRTFHEVATLPGIVIDRFREVGSRPDHMGYDTVIDETTGEGWKVMPPKMVDYRVRLFLSSGSAKDQMMLVDASKAHFRRQRLLVSRLTSARFTQRIVADYITEQVTGHEELHSGRFEILIENALEYHLLAERAYAVRRFTITGPPDVVVE